VEWWAESRCRSSWVPQQPRRSLTVVGRWGSGAALRDRASTCPVGPGSAGDRMRRAVPGGPGPVPVEVPPACGTPAVRYAPVPGACVPLPVLQRYRDRGPPRTTVLTAVPADRSRGHRTVADPCHIGAPPVTAWSMVAGGAPPGQRTGHRGRPRTRPGWVAAVNRPNTPLLTCAEAVRISHTAAAPHGGQAPLGRAANPRLSWTQQANHGRARAIST